MSFKDIKARKWEEAQRQLHSLLVNEIRRLLPLLPTEASWDTHQAIGHDLLRRLSQDLHQHTSQPVIILIDEYDALLLTVWEHGYFEDAVAWFRSFLSAGLKDNPHLFRGVLTGILRVARESLFSGLNNVIVFSLLQKSIPEPFGFTEAEVTMLLEQAERSTELSEFQYWYNGYRFGNTTVFNPWSILNAVARPQEPLQPWWVNTSENTLAIPNLEVRTVWEDSFQEWIIDGLGNIEPLHQALLTGDAMAVEELLGTLLLRHVSTWDLKDTQDEAFYHAFVLGLLVSLEKTHRVQSNREVGRGRADVQLAPKEAGKPGVILEFKKQVKGRTLGAMAEEALKQTETLAYTTELQSLGAAPVYRFGIAFAGKKVAVRVG